MNMFASARTMTRGDLRKAFDDYAEAHGQELATSALERSTGVREVPAVPPERIINGMTELVCGYSFVASARATGASSLDDRLSKLHGEIAAIGAKTFARLRKQVTAS